LEADELADRRDTPIVFMLERPLGTAASLPKMMAALFGYTVTSSGIDK
jgi:hypothetical protein